MLAEKCMSQGRRKDCPDIAPRIRRAFITACKRNGGSSYLTDKVEKSLEKDFVGTLNALAKFNPKTQNVNQTNTLAITVDSSVNAWVEGYKSGAKAVEESKQECLEHQAPATLPTIMVEGELEDAETALEATYSDNKADPVGSIRVKGR